MKQKDIIVMLAIGAGGYLLYSYLKSSGLWDQWFSGVSQPQPAPAPQPQPTGPPIPSVYVQPAPAPAPPPTNGAASDLRTELLNAAKDNAYYIQGGGKMNAHQWNFYRNQLRPPELSGEKFGLAFPSPSDEQLITVDEFLSRLQGAGLAGMSAIVPARPMPSMSFGTGFRQGGAFSGAFSGARRGTVH